MAKIKAKKWLAIGGVVMASLLLLSIIGSVLPKEKKCKHVWGAETVAVSETCGTNGFNVKICSECGETQHIIVPATMEHKWGTGTTAGKCQTCGFDIASFETVSVNEGDEAYGWYRLDKNSSGFSLGFSYINCGDFPIDSGSTVWVSYNNGPMSISFNSNDIILNDRYIMSYVMVLFSTVSLDDYYYFYIPKVVVSTVNISRDDTSAKDIELRMSFVFDSFEGLEKVLVS